MSEWGLTIVQCWHPICQRCIVLLTVAGPGGVSTNGSCRTGRWEPPRRGGEILFANTKQIVRQLIHRSTCQHLRRQLGVGGGLLSINENVNNIWLINIYSRLEQETGATLISSWWHLTFWNIIITSQINAYNDRVTDGFSKPHQSSIFVRAEIEIILSSRCLS